MPTSERPADEGLRPDRFFVTIKPSTRRQVRGLAGFDLDLQLAREAPEGIDVEGLLSLEEVAEVVRAGYPVLVSADAEERVGARQVIEFDEWLAAQRQDLGRIGEQ